METFDPKCAARHFGPWMIELTWLHQAVAMIEARMWQPMFEATGGAGAEVIRADEGGLAVLPMVGQLMKGESKYGGTSTLAMRRQVRALRRDDATKAVMLLIDSPGGAAAGTAELADDVRALAQDKPVHAHIEDLGASAAYWVASQADRITVNATGEVGSIGTMAAIADTSKAAEDAGIKVHVLSTGAYKAAGVPGAPITDEQVAHLQDRVNDLNGHFLEAVAEGRLVPRERVEEWASGKVWGGEKAAAMGLVDAVSTFEDAVGKLREAVPAPVVSRAGQARLRVKMARLAIDLRTRAL